MLGPASPVVRTVHISAENRVGGLRFTNELNASTPQDLSEQRVVDDVLGPGLKRVVHDRSDIDLADAFLFEPLTPGVLQVIGTRRPKKGYAGKKEERSKHGTVVLDSHSLCYSELSVGFQKLTDILKLIQAKNPALTQRIREAEAVSRWESVVGGQIAKHARAIKVQDGVLWVEVDHPVWRTELHHRKRQILDRMNQSVPSAPIQDLLLLDPRKSPPKSG